MSNSSLSCLDNLDRCQAKCCKELVFFVPRMNKQREEYYTTHGCEVFRVKRDLFKVIVPMRCPQLSEDNKCKLHGTESKPYFCRKLDKGSAHLFEVREDCIYHPGFAQELITIKEGEE